MTRMLTPASPATATTAMQPLRRLALEGSSLQPLPLHPDPATLPCRRLLPGWP